MGIKGLLLNTKSIGIPRHLSYYRNQTVGIDGYSWFHKALNVPDFDLFFKEDISCVFWYFSSKIKSIQKLQIKIVLVFDGKEHPLKKKTNQKRKQQRQSNRQKLIENYNQGNFEVAKKYIALSMSISPKMVKKLIDSLWVKFSNLEFIIAPYEADSQLAYLNRISYIDLVITEDSDLLLFGAKSLFYKMDNNFNGVSYLFENLKNCEEMNLRNWSHSKFIQMCVLSGCDYLDSPKGVGLKTAYFLMNKFSNAKNLIENYDKNLEPFYLEDFMCAYLAFKFSLIFCPVEKDLRYIEPFNQDFKIEDSFDFLAVSIARKFWPNFDFLGEKYDQELVEGLAYGRINHWTNEPFSVSKGKGSERR